jgi:hypothetical protein
MITISRSTIHKQSDGQKRTDGADEPAASSPEVQNAWSFTTKL